MNWQSSAILMLQLIKKMIMLSAKTTTMESENQARKREKCKFEQIRPLYAENN